MRLTDYNTLTQETLRAIEYLTVNYDSKRYPNLDEIYDQLASRPNLIDPASFRIHDVVEAIIALERDHFVCACVDDCDLLFSERHFMATKDGEDLIAGKVVFPTTGAAEPSLEYLIPLHQDILKVVSTHRIASFRDILCDLPSVDDADLAAAITILVNDGYLCFTEIPYSNGGRRSIRQASVSLTGYGQEVIAPFRKQFTVNATLALDIERDFTVFALSTEDAIKQVSTTISNSTQTDYPTIPNWQICTCDIADITATENPNV